MAGAKGYRSYRGRGTKRKILLALLLCLVILAAVMVILVQEHVVFDANGTPRLEIPWQKEEPEQTPELDLVIEEPEAPWQVRAYQVTTAPLTVEGWEQARMKVLASSDSSVALAADAALTMKDGSGRVYYNSQAAVPGAVETAEDTAEALAMVMRGGTEGAARAIARLSCLLDPIAAKADVEGMGLKNTGGYIFYDGNNENWLDPSKEKTQEYLASLAVECAELGFDEILLTDFSFPTQGKLDKIAYPEIGKEASLQACLSAIRTALDEAGLQDVLLSVELPADVILAGADETMSLPADTVDRVYAVTTEDQAEALSAAAEAAGTVFVPELSEPPAKVQNYLLLP